MHLSALWLRPPPLRPQTLYPSAGCTGHRWPVVSGDGRGFM